MPSRLEESKIAPTRLALTKSTRRKSAEDKSAQLKFRSRKFLVRSPSYADSFRSEVDCAILASFSSSTTSTPGTWSRSNLLETPRAHCTWDNGCAVKRLTCG